MYKLISLTKGKLFPHPIKIIIDSRDRKSCAITYSGTKVVDVHKILKYICCNFLKIS